MIFESLTDARLLVAVSQSASFAEAGRRLDMPPATVTRRIAAMEAVAGLKLFERSTRSVRPTEPGETMIGHARRLLDEVENAAMSIETFRDTPRGWISVTAPVILGQALFGEVIGSFLAENTDCDVFLDLSNDRTDLISGGYDLAVRVGPVGDSDLVVRKLGTAGAALYRGTRSKASPLASLDDLAGQSVGLLRTPERKRHVLHLTNAAGKAQDIEVAPRLITLDPLVLRAAALANDLIVVLPRMVAYPHVVAGRLRCELPDYAAQTSDVSVVFTSKRLMRPAVRTFIDHLAAELPRLLQRFEFPPT
ncbi:LysR substrate-binding domain-containing protein [Cognatiyoonia sp. IB215182]|uniref:LysR substrate-binding domain-containing protein n=1 Tax=Cognatiyoonia sp. IB215182 TaxID=3097353 RepID=UPI002A16A0D5|nr:LysR substrate-binding domain-containing protein [Cognatiyoonia sp. IB215182]MDX8355200.1 LysR substrate-binding domain-containing protein [Cognatiyoonia sp. IB215182]